MMEEPQSMNDDQQEADREETSGLMLLCVIAGLGLAFLGLLLVFTGIGALIGIGMIVLGGLTCVFGSVIALVREWRR